MFVALINFPRPFSASIYLRPLSFSKKSPTPFALNDVAAAVEAITSRKLELSLFSKLKCFSGESRNDWLDVPNEGKCTYSSPFNMCSRPTMEPLRIDAILPPNFALDMSVSAVPTYNLVSNALLTLICLLMNKFGSRYPTICLRMSAKRQHAKVAYESIASFSYSPLMVDA